MAEFKDKSGRLVKPGDLIAYGVAYGRCAGISYGKVLEIRKNDGYSRPQLYKLRVAGVDRPWSGIQVKKPGFLEFSNRVLIISREQVEPDILAKLDQIQVPDVQSSDTKENP